MKCKKKIIEYDVVQADPLPSEDQLAEFYANYYISPDSAKTGYDSSYTPDELKHKILESNIALAAIKDNLNDISIQRSLFEFGCGEGFFLNEAFKQNFQVNAIDFSNVGLAKWNAHLFDYCQFGNIYDFLTKMTVENKKYDVIVLRNVLEHVISPATLLSNIQKLLNKNGLALITVPNDYSIIQNSAMELNHINEEFWFEPPEHLYYFNVKNIRPFLKNYGFEIVDMFSSFPVDFFLFHPGSNYSTNKANGKAVHNARVTLDLILAKEGIENILNLYRAMAKCGAGRNLTVIVKSNQT